MHFRSVAVVLISIIAITKPLFVFAEPTNQDWNPYRGLQLELVCTLSETTNSYMQSWVGNFMVKLELNVDNKTLTRTEGSALGFGQFPPKKYPDMRYNIVHPDAKRMYDEPLVYLVRNYTDGRGGYTEYDYLEWLLVDLLHMTYEEREVKFVFNPKLPGSYVEGLGAGIFSSEFVKKYKCIRVK